MSEGVTRDEPESVMHATRPDPGAARQTMSDHGSNEPHSTIGLGVTLRNRGRTSRRPATAARVQRPSAKLRGTWRSTGPPAFCRRA